MSNTKKRILKMLTIVLIIFAGVGYAIHWAFFDIQRIKGQEYLSESTSPSGTYTVTAYLNNGGATTSYAVLGTVKNNNNNKRYRIRC